MKIAAIIAPSGTDFGLNAAFKIVCDTLTETGEDVQIFNLSSLRLDYYAAENSYAAGDIMGGIKAADGVIFAFPVTFFSPNALMQTFLEAATRLTDWKS